MIIEKLKILNIYIILIIDLELINRNGEYIYIYSI